MNVRLFILCRWKHHFVGDKFDELNHHCRFAGNQCNHVVSGGEQYWHFRDRISRWRLGRQLEPARGFQRRRWRGKRDLGELDEWDGG